MKGKWSNLSHCLVFSLYFWFLIIPKYSPSSSQDSSFSCCSSVTSILTVSILSAMVKFIRARVRSKAIKGKHNNIIAFCTISSVSKFQMNCYLVSSFWGRLAFDLLLRNIWIYCYGYSLIEVGICDRKLSSFSFFHEIIFRGPMQGWIFFII